VTIDQLQEQAAAVSRGQFVAEHPYPFLLVHGVVAASVLPFSTTVGSLSDMDRAPPEIFAVQKSGTNPYSARISLGRARNCDIVLRDASTSKLHAHFVFDDKGQVQLVDQGSRNGTTVNGRRVSAPVFLASSDKIVFGSVVAEFLNAQALYQMLVEF